MNTGQMQLFDCLVLMEQADGSGRCAFAAITRLGQEAVDALRASLEAEAAEDGTLSSCVIHSENLDKAFAIIDDKAASIWML